MGAMRAIGGVFLAVGMVLAMLGVAVMATSYTDESRNQEEGDGILFDTPPDEDRSDRNTGLFAGGAGTLGVGLLIMVVGGVLLGIGGGRGQEQQQTIVLQDPGSRP